MEELMLTVNDYAERAALSPRQVQRYLADGRLPGARKIRGKWLVPATSRPSSYDVVATSSESAELLPAVFEAEPARPRLGFELLTLDEAAAELGTTTGGVRRLAAVGRLRIGRFGPCGSLRVLVEASGQRGMRPAR
jgi:hypothetical protein